EQELAQFTHGNIADQVANMPRPEEGQSRWRRKNKRGAIIAGLIVDIRHIRKAGRIILTLDDGSSRIECSVFEQRAQQAQSLLEQDQLIIVEGDLGYDDFSDA